MNGRQNLGFKQRYDCSEGRASVQCRFLHSALPGYSSQTRDPRAFNIPHSGKAKGSIFFYDRNMRLIVRRPGLKTLAMPK